MFETAVVNEPSVFEPLKFYCSSVSITGHASVHISSVKLWSFVGCLTSL